MITESSFYSQLTSFENDFLAHRTCGVTCAAMVIDHLVGLKLDKSLSPFLAHVVSNHKASVQTYRRRFDTPFGPIYIVVDHTGGKLHVQKTDILFRADADYFPAFSLNRGYDHRASDQLFKYFGLDAALIEGIEADSMFTLLRSRAIHCFLASTHYQGVEGPGSHVVIVHKIDRKGVHIVDPVELNFEKGQKILPVHVFKRLYRGYGTAVFV